MHDYINNLSFTLRLTPYQLEVLKNNVQKYNIGRIVKRGGVLYVPYASCGVVSWFIKFICGARADLIGQNKTLITNRRNIKFCKNGYHCVKIGAYTYYADASGQAISRENFLRAISR